MLRTVRTQRAASAPGAPHIIFRVARLELLMGIRIRLRRLLEPIIGVAEPAPPLPAPPTLPHGADLFGDLAARLPHFRPSVVFDVGAHTGSTARQYVQGFPEALIYCFEPVAATYSLLQANLGAEARVRCFQLAFGAGQGTGTMVLHGAPDTFYLAEAGQRPEVHGEAPREVVHLERIDGFCAGEGIERISFLKIDTEGADFEVLHGAERLLAAQRIDLVEVEAGMNPRNSWHVPLEVFKPYLEARGYFLFGIYEQVEEWPTGEPHLRRVNAVFVSTPTIEANRRAQV